MPIGVDTEYRKAKSTSRIDCTWSVPMNLGWPNTFVQGFVIRTTMY